MEALALIIINLLAMAIYIPRLLKAEASQQPLETSCTSHSNLYQQQSYHFSSQDLVNSSTESGSWDSSGLHLLYSSPQMWHSWLQLIVSS